MPRPTRIRPYLAELLAPPPGDGAPPLSGRLRIASYNVHRWSGVGGRSYDPGRIHTVLDEIGADVVALQEVLQPTGEPDPLRATAERFGVHLAFVVTRKHRRGLLGNAVLSRWPLAGALAIDLSFGRLEKRAALAVRVEGEHRSLRVAATHLALVDRTRARQVRALLEHELLADGPTVLLGDINAWRRSKASRALDDHFETMHHNLDWPPSYPSVRPVLALDRLYARGARVVSLATHASEAARKASDHLPIVATVELEGD